MNRQEILDAYKVNQYGIIISRGCFEGEMLYLPYFWAMAESADEKIGPWYVFEITAEDQELWPEIESDVTHILVRSDEQGLIFGELCDGQISIDRFRKHSEKDEWWATKQAQQDASTLRAH